MNYKKNVSQNENDKIWLIAYELSVLDYSGNEDSVGRVSEASKQTTERWKKLDHVLFFCRNFLNPLNTSVSLIQCYPLIYIYILRATLAFNGLSNQRKIKRNTIFQEPSKLLWKCNRRRNVNPGFFIATMHRVVFIFWTGNCKKYFTWKFYLQETSWLFICSEIKF